MDATRAGIGRGGYCLALVLVFSTIIFVGVATLVTTGLPRDFSAQDALLMAMLAGIILVIVLKPLFSRK